MELDELYDYQSTYPTSFPQESVVNPEDGSEVFPDWIVEMESLGWPIEDMVGPLYLAAWSPAQIAKHLAIPKAQVQAILQKLNLAWVTTATKNQLDIRVRDMALLEHDQALLRTKFHRTSTPELSLRYHDQMLKTMQQKHKLLEAIPQAKRSLRSLTALQRDITPVRRTYLDKIHSDPEARKALRLLAEKQIEVGMGQETDPFLSPLPEVLPASKSSSSK